ncbi:MAG: M17 family peptidase N-terminal domain-containing protein [Silvibacterium sp.]
MSQFRRQYRSFAEAFILACAICASAQSAQVQSLPIRVLVQSPADTAADLQIICLFRSSPENTLHGSLVEINQKLNGLFDQVRKPGLFGGELGETLLLTPPPGTLAAKRLLIIGLGDSSTFTPARMYLIGKIAYRESSRLDVVHPFFAPTILDGGVTGFATGEVAGQVVRGFRDAQATESVLATAHAAAASPVRDLTFLAGAEHAADTQTSIDHALKSN